MGLFFHRDKHQKNGFEITNVDISHDAIRQSNGSYWNSDFATVYYKNKNSYSVWVVLLVKLTKFTPSTPSTILAVAMYIG